MIEWRIKGVFKANAEDVYKEITSIGDDYTPEQVVEKARDKSTELHKCFDWDDTTAAEKYRCLQAGKIIRSLVFTPEPKKEIPRPEPIRLIVSQNERNNKYQPIQVTVRDDDAYQKLLKAALAELDAFRRKYKNLKELESVIDAIEETLGVA